MQIIKRSYGHFTDYLLEFDHKWGTACIGNKAKAMAFTDIEIKAAVAHANETCYGKPDAMVFTAVPV